LGLLRKDSRGQIFSLDLLLALIPITLIIGMAAANMDSMLYLTQSAVFQSSTERAASDTVRSLLETSGSPIDWEMSGNPRIAGLAEYDYIKSVPVEGTTDAIKLGQLNQSHIQDMIGNDYGFFLNVTRVGDNYSVKTLGTYNSSAKNIVRIERFVLYGYLKIVSSAKDLLRYNPGPPRVYTSPPDPFPTNLNYVNTFDYWALVVNRGYDSATVEINNNRVVDPNDFRGQATRYANITKQVDSRFLYNETYFMNNTVTVRGTSNPWSSLDVYIVQVPKNTDPGQINPDNIERKRYRFLFYLWVK
jgi:hypothetical protein